MPQTGQNEARKGLSYTASQCSPAIRLKPVKLQTKICRQTPMKPSFPNQPTTNDSWHICRASQVSLNSLEGPEIIMRES